MANAWLNGLQQILGINISKEDKEQDVDVKKSIQLPEPPKADGAIELDVGQFQQFGTTFDYKVPEDEVQLITKYRDMAMQPEFDRAINEIVNEFFAYQEDAMPVSLNLDEVKLSESTKKKVHDEFDYLLNLMNFKTDSYEIFKRWYIDGRLFYHKVIDENAKKKGIQQLKYIDPRKIRKVRQLEKSSKKPDLKTQIETNLKYKEYYVYNPKGITNNNPQGIAISKDSIAYVHSGLFTNDNKTVLSYIHKAIRFFNTMRNVEDSVVIYRLARSSEKRVFNVELGDIPAAQAQQHMNKVIDKFRKRLSYNPQTGEVIEQKRFTTMLEDFWFAKRNGQGTTVEFLQGGQNLGEMEDVEYFKKKFYESLDVPINRLDPNSTFTLGRASEITREELRFQKFISRLRKRFSHLFEDLLKTQLILKNIMTEKDWNEFVKQMSFDYLEDNFFSELKMSEIYQNRFATAQATGFQGNLVSAYWIKKNLLQMTEEEIEDDGDKMAEEGAEQDAAGLGAEKEEQDEDEFTPGKEPADTKLMIRPGNQGEKPAEDGSNSNITEAYMKKEDLTDFYEAVEKIFEGD
jgi:hypothetical protein